MTEEQRRLVEENHNLIYYYLNKRNLPVEDLYGVAAIGLCKAAESHDGDISKFSTYAVKCINNEVNNHLRNYYRMKTIPDYVCVSLHTCVFDNGKNDKQLYIEDVVPDRADVFDDVYTKLIFEKFLSTLSPEYRQILDMSSKGIEQQEIGDALGIARNTVCWRMKQMYKKLKRMLEED